MASPCTWTAAGWPASPYPGGAPCPRAPRWAAGPSRRIPMRPIPKRVPWPDGVQMPVVLMFDMDAESLFISVDPEVVPKKPVVLSQGEYGPRVGVPRILRLLQEYDIKASFYIPGVSVEKYPEAVDEILAGGHEISHHMYTHKRNDEMTPDEE